MFRKVIPGDTEGDVYVCDDDAGGDVYIIYIVLYLDVLYQPYGVSVVSFD